MKVRVENFDVYVNGERIEEPRRKFAIAVPSLILGMVLAIFILFVVLPLLGLGLALLVGLIALVVGAFAAFLVLSPLLIPALVAIGFFRWLLSDDDYRG